MFKNSEDRFDDGFTPGIGSLSGRTSLLGAHPAMGSITGPGAASRTQIQSPRHVGVRYIGIDVALFHGFQVVDGKEAAVSQRCSWRRSAALLDLIHHWLQRSVVGCILRHPRVHNQMIVRNADLGGVAEDKTLSALAQEASVLVGLGQLLQAAFFQSLHSSRHLRQCLVQFPDRHFQPARLLIVPVSRLLPVAYLAAKLRSRIAQRLLAVHAIFARIGGNACGINRHPAQLHHALRLGPLQHLGESIIQRSTITTAERAQSPVVYPLSTSKVAKGKILHQTTLHLPRTRNAQRVGVKPNSKHQLWRVEPSSFAAVALLKSTHIQPLDHLAYEKTQMSFAQLVSHARRQQIRLIRTVYLEPRHAHLVAQTSSQYKYLTQFSRRLFSPDIYRQANRPSGPEVHLFRPSTYAIQGNNIPQGLKAKELAR